MKFYIGLIKNILKLFDNKPHKIYYSMPSETYYKSSCQLDYHEKTASSHPFQILVTRGDQVTVHFHPWLNISNWLRCCV